VKAGRLQCKDIDDEVFMGAVRRTFPVTASGGWRTRWDVLAELESSVGPVPGNLLLAKARQL
jgi:hypothetical protein